MFGKFLAKETAYFKKLHSDTQKLLQSIFLYNLIGPIFGIFMSAFLWRQSHDVMLIALYNAIQFAIIPFGFYLNGILLKKYSPAILYFLSLAVSGMTVAFLIFIPKIDLSIISIMGFINGLSSGIFWANRNLLTLKTTKTDNRLYFSSLESSSNNFTDVVVPLVIGWFISLGAIIHLYSPLQAYQMIAVYMLLTIIAVGFVINGISIKHYTVTNLFVHTASSKWKKFRLLEFILGFKEAAVTFIPPLLVLILVGKEGTLGTVEAISTLFASLLIYAVAKKLKTSHRVKLIALSVLITVVASGIFGLLYSAIGVLIFFAGQALAGPFIWVAIQSLNYDLIDEDNKDPKYHYAYVCDQEIYLNGGRAIGIVCFMLLILLTSNEFALRFAPVLFAASQILLFVIARSIEKKA